MDRRHCISFHIPFHFPFYYKSIVLMWAALCTALHSSEVLCCENVTLILSCCWASACQRQVCNKMLLWFVQCKAWCHSPNIDDHVLKRWYWIAFNMWIQCRRSFQYSNLYDAQNRARLETSARPSRMLHLPSAYILVERVADYSWNLNWHPQNLEKIFFTCRDSISRAFE